jgi:hypothetical protein
MIFPGKPFCRKFSPNPFQRLSTIWWAAPHAKGGAAHQLKIFGRSLRNPFYKKGSSGKSSQLLGNFKEVFDR